MIGLMDEVLAEGFHYINKTMAPDGRGSSIEKWVRGGPFRAVVELSNALEEAVAEAQGVKGIYDVSTDDDVRLEWHQVFERDRDGQIFRITSKDENVTPEISAIGMRKTRAEDWQLPSMLEE